MADVTVSGNDVEVTINRTENTITISPTGSPGADGADASTDWVTFENLDSNGDVGTGSSQVAEGDHTHSHWVNVIIDGGGSAIETGIKTDLVLPACTIEEVTLLADQSGSIVVDLWKDTYANFPPTDADTITSSTPPTITTATKANDATLTSWTTSITAEDILRINVDSCTTIERCTLAIKVTI